VGTIGTIVWSRLSLGFKDRDAGLNVVFRNVRIQNFLQRWANLHEFCNYKLGPVVAITSSTYITLTGLAFVAKAFCRYAGLYVGLRGDAGALYPVAVGVNNPIPLKIGGTKIPAAWQENFNELRPVVIRGALFIPVLTCSTAVPTASYGLTWTGGAAIPFNAMISGTNFLNTPSLGAALLGYSWIASTMSAGTKMLDWDNDDTPRTVLDLVVKVTGNVALAIGGALRRNDEEMQQLMTHYNLPEDSHYDYFKSYNRIQYECRSLASTTLYSDLYNSDSIFGTCARESLVASGVAADNLSDAAKEQKDSHHPNPDHLYEDDRLGKYYDKTGTGKTRAIRINNIGDDANWGLEGKDLEDVIKARIGHKGNYPGHMLPTLLTDIINLTYGNYGGANYGDIDFSSKPIDAEDLLYAVHDARFVLAETEQDIEYANEELVKGLTKLGDSISSQGRVAKHWFSKTRGNSTQDGRKKG
jgi:hypothetical protein